MINIPVSECTFKFHAIPEEIQPEDMFSEQTNVDYIYRQLESGNKYAWFLARVTCRWKEFSYSAYLGACSYNSESEFLSCEYYNDLCNEAHEGLVNSINETYTILKEVANG